MWSRSEGASDRGSNSASCVASRLREEHLPRVKRYRTHQAACGPARGCAGSYVNPAAWSAPQWEFPAVLAGITGGA